MSLKASLSGWWVRWQVRGWLLIGQVARAQDCLVGRLSEQPDDRYAMSSLAVLLARQGDREGAVRMLRELVDLFPSDAAGWFNLGFLLESLDRPDEAVVAFRRAVSLDPGLDRAWYGLGLCLIRLRRWDEAVDALRRNTALQPMNPFGWYQLARLHADRQELEEASRIIRHLRGFEPKVADQLERETGLVRGDLSGEVAACP